MMHDGARRAQVLQLERQLLKRNGGGMPSRINSRTAVRSLLRASEVYQQTVEDTVEVIRSAIDEGQLVGREYQYAQLLMALTEAERALTWVAERSRVLLGEQEEDTT